MQWEPGVANARQDQQPCQPSPRELWANFLEQSQDRLKQQKYLSVFGEEHGASRR